MQASSYTNYTAPRSTLSFNHDQLRVLYKAINVFTDEELTKHDERVSYQIKDMIETYCRIHKLPLN